MDGHQHGISIQMLINLGKKVSPHILHKKNYYDLNLGEDLCILTFFLFSDSGLNLLNAFDFYFEWRGTENQQLPPKFYKSFYGESCKSPRNFVELFHD